MCGLPKVVRKLGRGRWTAGAGLRAPGRMVLVAVVVALSAGGCGQFEAHRRELARLHAQGAYEAVAEQLDSERVQRLYGVRNALLWHLERGAVALALDDAARTVQELEQAERQIELYREATPGDELSRWVMSDASAAYVAEPYEDMYLNVLKLLAHLESGRIEGAATVEARRLGSKANLLRDAYVRYEAALGPRRAALGASSWSAVNGTGSSAVVARDSGGQFVESPLGTYLTAITFMASGDREFQRVAGRRLVDAIRVQAGLIGPVRVEPFEGLGELDPEDAAVMVVALSGRGPTRRAERYGPILVGTLPVYFELPVLVPHPSEVVAVKVVVEPDGDSTGAIVQARREWELALVEDLGLVAAENHRQQMPLIYTRTLLRVAAKAGLSVTATEMARRSVRDRQQVLVQVAGALAGLVAMMATERADLRSWTMLPGQAHVGVLDLPPGRYRIRADYIAAGGRRVYSSPWRTVQVDGEQVRAIVEHYWG